MDAQPFDRVVQTFAADGVSRRRVLKGLLGVAAGGALARVGSRPAEAGNGCQIMGTVGTRRCASMGGAEANDTCVAVA